MKLKVKQEKFSKQDYIVIWEVCSKKEQYGDWDEVCKVLNTRLNKNYSEAAYRKTYQYWALMDNAIKECIGSDNDFAKEIAVQKRELEREKIKFRDERNAWQKQNYVDARVEQKLDYLEDLVKKTAVNKYQYKAPVHISNNEETMIVCLSDLHIGACFDNVFGKYNSDIAEARLNEYLSEVIKIGKRHNIQNVAVLGMGDEMNGNIHKSIQVTNRENVIEQIIKASELISWFIDELTNIFNVQFINIAGNHTRLDRKEDALKDERLDSLIGWYVKSSLSHNSNFSYIEPVDTSFGMIEIQNNLYYVCHGDYDQFGKNGLGNLVLATGLKPKGVFYGHLHHARMEDCSDVMMIQSGSLCGSGDDYTIEKRLICKPSQTVCIVDNDGVNCIYPVHLH